MSDSEKPFACTTVGCNMSFVNEDHLTVHKKKHDMMLNLGINNKNNFFIADQTPTPTRFIRNCDEVGLFQDLQNDNPFEETFRRAVEAGKSGVVSVSEAEENDDTLHTPNIFPQMTEECSTSVTSVTIKNQVTKLDTKTITEPSIITPIVSSEVMLTSDIINDNEDSNKKRIDKSLKEDAVMPIVDDSSLNSSSTKTETHLPINAAEMQLLLKTEDGKVLRFVAAPVVEVQEDPISSQTKKQNVTKTKVIVNNFDNSNCQIGQGQKLAVAKMKLKHALTKNGTVIGSKPIGNNENENKSIEHSKERRKHIVEHTKKQAILERNRASSMRARAKRKAWIEQLQQSLKKANETNANLQAQVKSLHAQVAKLKTLLLAHKDCPVTKDMEKGNGIVASSKIVSIKPNEVKQVSGAPGSLKQIKRANTEKSIVPKKKPLMLSTIKNPIILPKSESNANTITLHGTETMTTIPTIRLVTPFIANAKSGKTVLSFLPSNSGKVSLVPDPFSVNEDFNENAASKTTGS